ncbi:hypothetical protein L209DRAFT_159666 [Thermothelomyces heterothallicus CBS 203.75]
MCLQPLSSRHQVQRRQPNPKANSGSCPSSLNPRISSLHMVPSLYHPTSHPTFPPGEREKQENSP